jgi:hypothetical protein
MAHLYIDDGQAESEDYENNYIYFNAEDSRCVQKIMKLSQTLATLTPERKSDLLDKIRRGQQRSS